MKVTSIMAWSCMKELLPDVVITDLIQHLYFLFVRFFKFIGKFFWKKIDGAVIDKFGPDGISSLIKIISSIAVKFQNGFIYHYAFVMLLGFSVLLTFLILK